MNSWMFALAAVSGFAFAILKRKFKQALEDMQRVSW